MSRTGCPSRGFTLLEVLAVLFLTALVIGVALDFYVDLSNQSAHASEVTREVRRATGLLDRVAHDLERTLLVQKPPEMDPLANPWVFVAESRISSEGADRIKFVAREPGQRSQRQTAELSMVAFMLRESEDGDGYDLLRWSSPSLPDSLDREFPLPDDPNTLVLAHGVHLFAMRFLDESGEWVSEWDSSQLLDSGSLPLAVEIEVAMEPLENLLPEEADALTYQRRVLLPVRPLDLVALLDPDAGAAATDDEGDCDESLLVRDCVDESALSQMTGGAVNNVADAQAAAGGGVDFEAILDSSWCSIRSLYRDHPAVKASCR